MLFSGLLTQNVFVKHCVYHNQMDTLIRYVQGCVLDLYTN